MLAIVVVIIVTSVALLFLSYFQISYYVLNTVESYSISRNYCFDGLQCLNLSTPYETPDEIRFSDGLQVNILKKRWGVYDLYFSTVIKNSKDTVYSKIALSGYQKDNATDLSLYLRKTNVQFTIGDSVSISGKCYVPSAQLKSYNKKDNSSISKDQILYSADTFVRTNYIDSIVAWARKNTTESTIKVVCDEAIDASFQLETVYISADTVFISGSIQGNIIVSAKHIKILPTAQIRNIILIGGSVDFPDNFSGQLQVFASESITIGNNTTFKYPSILALMPEITKELPSSGSSYFIKAGDSFKLYGEIYAYAYRYDLSTRISTIFAPGAAITGCLYSTGTLTFEGNCKGSIVCEKLLNYNSGSMQANFMKNTTIDSIPNIFSYSSIFPYQGQKKIVSWVK